MTEESIVAVYDTVARADAAVRDLEAMNVPPSAITRHSGNSTTGGTGSMEPAREKGFWSSLFGGDPGHDEEVYNRSLAGGSSVVVVKVAEQHVQQVTDVLERHSPIDIDEQSHGYGSGMGGSATTTTTTATEIPAAGAVATGTATTGRTATGMPAAGLSSSSGAHPTAGGMQGGEEVLALSEEQLSVGKRLINRGTTRIRRFVVETPVEEAVNLRSEHVSVERRPVTGGAKVGTADFTDRTIEVTETEEEAVVAKTAHVTEEVVINKQATERTETVRDTVRREDVEITKDPVADTHMSRTEGTMAPHVDRAEGTTAAHVDRMEGATETDVSPAHPRV